MTTKTESDVRIVQSGECKKLTTRGAGTILYEIGFTASEQLVMRISQNVGSTGTYSREWVSVDAVEKLLKEQVKPNTTFRSTLFKPVFKSKSVNNSGYLAAILKHLRVIDSVVAQPTQLVFLSFTSMKTKIAEAFLSDGKTEKKGFDKKVKKEKENLFEPPKTEDGQKKTVTNLSA